MFAFSVYPYPCQFFFFEYTNIFLVFGSHMISFNYKFFSHVTNLEQNIQNRSDWNLQ